MKRTLILTVMVIALTTTAHAGGLMTNTNYHIAFDRMMARGASTDIDAAYSNPAGLAWGHEGWQLSLNFQKPWQFRNIEVNGTKYEGKASAPIVPALFASYKHNRWALSTMIGIVGSGGYVEYKQGVPMYNMLLQGLLAQNGIHLPADRLPFGSRRPACQLLRRLLSRSCACRGPPATGRAGQAAARRRPEGLGLHPHRQPELPSGRTHTDGSLRVPHED